MRGSASRAGHRQVDAPAGCPGERKPCLVSSGCGEGMNVAQVDIGAVRGVLIDGPRDVAARGVAQHVPRKEVGRRHMVLCAEVLVIFAQVFVFRSRDGEKTRVCSASLRRIEAGAIGQRDGRADRIAHVVEV